MRTSCGLVVLTLVALAVAPPAAQSGGPPPPLFLPYYVNQSDPDRSDSGPCTASTPCATIQEAVSRAVASSSRKTVRVLPDPNGATDVYYENVGTGFNSTGTVRLIGAGAGSGGTVIQAADGPLQVGVAATVSFVRVVATGDNATALTGGAADVRFENVVAEAPTGTVYRSSFSGGGTVVDSTLSGARGVYRDDDSKIRLVRTVVAGSQYGVHDVSGSSPDTVALLDSIVRGGNQPGSVGINIAGGAEARLRHVTVLDYPTRVRVAGSYMSTLDLEAANSTFADDGGVDLSMEGTDAAASLTATNFSPSRTVVTGGAPAPTTAQPVDVAPGLTADGHLAPGSALIDKGASGGVLASDPDDGLDIDRQPRVQGGAVDIGADEAGSASSVPAAPEDDPGAGDPGGGDGGASGGSGGGGVVGDGVTGPRFAMRLARVQRVLRTRAIAVSIMPEQDVSLVGSATVTVPRGAAASVRLKTARGRAVAGRAMKLKMKVTKRGLARLRAALGKRRTLTARIKVVAAGAGGGKTTVTRTVRVRR